MVQGREPAVPGTVFVHALGDAVTFGPKEGRDLWFGRNRPAVHLCVGEDDLTVSRRQGRLSCAGGRWWLHNTGSLGIRIGESRLVCPDDEPVPLGPGYTSLLVEGSGGRVHLVEVLIAGDDGWGRRPQHGGRTIPVRAWDLHPEERLAVVVVAQAYLRNEPNPKPVSWPRAAELLAELDPGRGWTDKKVEHRVRALRLRLAASAVNGLIQPEVGGSGDELKRNLIKVLITSNTIGPRDLALIEFGDGGGA